MTPLRFHLRPISADQYRLEQEGGDEAWQFPDHEMALDHVATLDPPRGKVVYLEDAGGKRLVAIFV